MNSVNKDGLKKIYLFKSADYQFAEIDLTDDTLLLGGSGVGKTTLMRAVLFFYTMDYDPALLNINTETKKTFIQWYFKEHNSHIVYEYMKDGSTYLFIVSNSGKLHYTFVQMNHSDVSVADLLLNGREPVVFEKLNENIDRYKLPHYHTAKKNRYMHTFHKYYEKGKGQKRIKHESEINFVLFEDVASRKEFAKTLSNIFATSKVSSDSVKKTIVSLIDDTSASIDLKEIKNSLSEYVEYKNQIKDFEKRIPRIHKLADILAEYKHRRELFKKNANQIHQLKNQSAIKITDIEIQIAKKQEEQKELNSIYQPKIERFAKDIDEKNAEIIVESNEIKKLERKKEEYYARDIDALVTEHHKRRAYEESLMHEERRYKALTSDADDIKERYRVIFQSLLKEKEDSILIIQRETLEKREKINAQKMEVFEDETQHIVEATNDLAGKQQHLEVLLEGRVEAFRKTEIAQAKVVHHPYNNENIQRFSAQLKKFEHGLFALSPKILKIKSSIEFVEKQIDTLSSNLVDAKQALSSKIAKAKETLFATQEKIRQKLDFDKDNLYGYINKNNIENREKIVTYIKDEVLFSDKRFKIKQVDNTQSLFGLDIDFIDEDFGFDYDQISLLAELERIKKRLKEWNATLREKNIALEEKASYETRKLDKRRTKLYQERDASIAQQKNYRINKQLSEDNLAEAKEEAKKSRIKETEKLNIQYLKQKEEITLLNQRKDTLVRKIIDISKKIKAKTRTVIDTLDASIVLLGANEDKTIKEMIIKYNQDLETSKKEFHDILEKKGIDKKLLEDISRKIDTLRSKIDTIESNTSTVMVYLSEYIQEIQKIPTRKKNLEKKRYLWAELNNELIKIKEAFKSKNQNILMRIQALEDMQMSLATFMKRYTDTIANQKIETEISNSLSVEYNEDMHDLLNSKTFMDSVINELILSYSDLEVKRTGIMSQTQQSIRGLDKSNIFKIDIIDDYIAQSDNISAYLLVAEGLVEYVKKDKIIILKDESSEKFKNHLNSIQKYLGLFEDAIMDIDEKVTKLKNTVKKAVESFKVIDSIHIRNQDANNQILNELKSVTSFYAQNNENFLGSLFDIKTNTQENKNAQEELGNKIEDLVMLLESSKEILYLEEGFVLEFKIVENSNDLGWRQTLNDVGSNGTSTLVKAIINISILQMVNTNSQLINHCILDEIGTISTEYFKELKAYVNSSGFLFVNGMPIEDDILISMYPTVYIGQNNGTYSRMLLASKMIV